MELDSPYPPVTIPLDGLAEYVLSAIPGRERKPALLDALTGASLSYGELGDRVRDGAQALHELGVRKGDILAVISESSWDAVIALYAACLIGAAVTPVSPLYTVEEVATQVRDAGARWIAFSEHARQGAVAAAAATAVVSVELPLAPSASAQQLEPVALDSEADLALLPYSSGTTGLPKGVMLTHRNLVGNLAQISAVLPFEDDDIVLAALPFNHLTGLQLLLNLSLANGATVVTLPRFELEHFLAAIQRHRVTRAFIVPPIALMLDKDPLVERYDLSSLRALFCGAAPIGPELQVSCTRRIGCPILQGYGLTESGPIVTHVTEADGLDQTGSAGRPVPNTKLRIVDVATLSDVAPGERGEIWISGPQVMRGYLNRPQETAATLPAGGWLRSGDIGYIDDRGRLHIVDRLKEMIKYKGFQVAPAELEAVLISHPAVTDAAVIPSLDPDAGEVPKALVVCAGGVSAEALKSFVAARVAPYKKVRRLAFIDSIPKSASGKILRRALIERERAGDFPCTDL